MERLKLRRMRVKGFKSLADVDLRLNDDLTLLIGANGAGKSTVLQALAFVRSFAKGQPKAFFEERDWDRADVRSRIKDGGKRAALSFEILLRSGDGRFVFWGFDWDFGKLKCLEETVAFSAVGDGEPQFIPAFSNLRGINSAETGNAIIQPDGSLLPILAIERFEPASRIVLQALQSWATGLYSLELLSPAEMRRGHRGSATDIGPRGERLAGFLASLSPAQKDRIVGRLMPFYPIRNVETTRKRAGWVDLRIAEAFEGAGRTGAEHMSDGFLRMLGLAAIPEFADSVSTVLLDEIEDGIDPHILPRFIDVVAREAKAQIVATSHSPVLVNAFDPRQIAFVARAPDGRTVAAPFSDIGPLVDGLEYFGPGEVWANTDMDRINRLVLEAHDARPPEPESRNRADAVKRFMGLAR